MFFISFEEHLSLVRYLSFCPDIFSHAGKWLDKKIKFNYDVINWGINNHNTHIAKYLKK